MISLPCLEPPPGFSGVLPHPREEAITPFVSPISGFLHRASWCQPGAKEANKCSLAARGPVCHGGTQAPEHLGSHLGLIRSEEAQGSCGHEGVHEDIQTSGGYSPHQATALRRVNWLRMKSPPGTAPQASALSGRTRSPDVGSLPA